MFRGCLFVGERKEDAMKVHSSMNYENIPFLLNRCRAIRSIYLSCNLIQPSTRKCLAHDTLWRTVDTFITVLFSDKNFMTKLYIYIYMCFLKKHKKYLFSRTRMRSKKKLKPRYFSCGPKNVGTLHLYVHKKYKEYGNVFFPRQYTLLRSLP